MGCDMHIFLEKKEGDKWVDNTPYERDTWDGSLQPQDYYCRSYLLFSMLAGVRNSEGIKPIARPRGIPDDCSKEYRDFVEQWTPDGHSHSYFTIAELDKAYTKCKSVIQRETLGGFVNFLLKMAEVMNPYYKILLKHNEFRVCFFFDN